MQRERGATERRLSTRIRTAAGICAVSLVAGSFPVVGSFIGAGDGDLEKNLLRAADGGASSGELLDPGALATAVASSIDEWRVVAGDDALRDITVELADLPDGELGRADGDRIAIDVDASGHGWGSAGMDLATVVRHELGHALGFGHDASGLMASTLAAGETHGVPNADAVHALPLGTGAQALEAVDATATDGGDAPATDDGTAIENTTTSDAVAGDPAPDSTVADETVADETVTDETSIDDAVTEPAVDDATTDDATTDTTTDDTVPTDLVEQCPATTDEADAACDAPDTATTTDGDADAIAEDAAVTAPTTDEVATEEVATDWILDGSTAVFVAGDTLVATVTYDAATNSIVITSADGTVDSFSLTGVTGITISGSSGDDQITIDLDGLPAGLVVSIDGGAGNDTVVGPSTDATWTIDGAGSGTVGSVVFSGAENLAGGDGNQDTFVFGEGGSIIGMLTGGDGGFDSIVVGGTIGQLDLSVTAVDAGTIGWNGNTVVYGGFEPVTIDGSVGTVNITTASVPTGPTGANDTITIQDSGAAGDGTFEILFSAGETHTFNVAGSITSLTINAGLGNDHFILTSIDSAFHGVITLNGQDGDDTFSVPDTAATWTIDGINQGRYQSGTAPPAVIFTGVENLNGALTAADTFEFESGAGLSGAIDDFGGTLTVSAAFFVQISGNYSFGRISSLSVTYESEEQPAATTTVSALTVTDAGGTGFIGVNIHDLTAVGVEGDLGDFGLAIFTNGVEAWHTFVGTLTDVTFIGGLGDIEIATGATVTIGVNDRSTGAESTWIDFGGPGHADNVDLGNVTFDFTGSMQRATADVAITIGEYVHVSGALTIERGERYIVDIATGLPSNAISIASSLGLTSVAVDFLNALPTLVTAPLLDPLNDLYIASDLSYIYNVTVSSLKIGFTDAALFVGYFPDWMDSGDGLGGAADGHIQEEELGETAVGLFANDVDLVILKMAPKLTTSFAINTAIGSLLPEFMAIKGTIASVEFVGVGDFDLQVSGITIQVNNGDAWPGGLGPPVVDFTQSFAGGALAVSVGGVNTSFDFDGNQRFGIRAEHVLLTISDAFYLAGSFSFEKGPVQKVDVATYLSQHEAAAIDALIGIFGAELIRMAEDDTKEDLAGALGISHDLATIYNLEVATTKIGIGNAAVFVGWAPGMTLGATPLTVDDLGDDAIGLFVGGVDVGVALFTPTLSALPGLSALPTFMGMKVHADTIQLIGVPGVRLSADGVDIVVNTGDAWPGDLGPPIVDFESTFGEDGLEIDTGVLGEPVILDMPGLAFTGVYVEDAVLSLGGFIHVSGSFAFESGDSALVTVATGFPDNLGDELAALTLDGDIDAFWSALGFDPDSLPTFSSDLSQVLNLEVGLLTVGAADVDIFVGFDPTLLTFDGGDYSPGASAVGLWIEDAEIAVVVATPTLSSLISTLPKFYAFKAHAETIELIGVEDVGGEEIITMSATGVDVWVNNATRGWGPANAWVPVIDWATSFPLDGDDGLGFEVAGSTLVIDFDGNQRIGGSAEQVVLGLAGFVYVSGSFFFEQGPVQKINVATYLSQHEVAVLDALFPDFTALRLGENDVAPTIGGDLKISHDLSTIYNVEVSVLRLGIANATAFVGYNPGWTFGVEDGSTLQLDDLGDDAVGILATGVNAGFVVMTPTLATIPGLSSIPTLWALKATVASVQLIGVPGVTLSATDVTIRLNQGDLWPGERGPPVIDFEGTFPSGYIVPTGTPGLGITMDLPSVQFIGIELGQAILSLAGFVHISGSFAFEKGDGALVSIATGFPDNAGDLLAGLGLGATVADLLESLGFDPAFLPTISNDFSTLSNVEVAFLTIGASDLNIFVGYNPGWTTAGSAQLERDDLSDDAVGLWIEGATIGFVLATPTLAADIESLPKLYALKAHADVVELVGMDANGTDIVTITATGVDIWVNNATFGWGPGNAWTPALDWGTSFPADLGDAGDEDDIPAGLAINTGDASNPVYIDFDGNQRIGGHADQVLVTVGGFLYVSGELFFEMGPVTKVSVATYLAQHEVAIIDVIDDLLGNPVVCGETIGTTLCVTDDYATIHNVEVSVLQLAIVNATAFLGYNPGWGSWDAEDDVFDIDDLSDEAVGLFLSGVDIGFVQMAPTLGSIPGLANVVPSFWAMQAQADSVDLVGFTVGGVDLLELHAEDILIEVNTGTEWPGGFGPPIVDWETTYPGVEDDPLTLDIDEEVAPGFVIGAGWLSEPITIAMPGLDLLRVTVGHAVISMLDFVHVSGSFTFEQGDAALVTVATGFPDNVGDLLTGLGISGGINGLLTSIFGAGALPSISGDFSQIFDLEVAFMKVGASNVDIFVGYNPGDGDFDSIDDLGDGAVGLFIDNATVAFVLGTPTLQSLVSALPNFYGLKAHADQIALVGIDDADGDPIITLSGTGIDIWVNNATRGWGPGGAWTPVIDWAASFPAVEDDLGTGDIDESTPMGLEIPTGPGSSIFIDFDGNQRIGGSAEHILLQISDFIHVSGGLFFEMGPVMKVQMATGVNSLNRAVIGPILDLLGLTLEEGELPPAIGGDLAIAEDYSYIYNVEVSVLQVSVTDAYVFVGYAPGMALDPVTKELDIDADAVGLLIEDLDLGFVMMTPTLATVPGLSVPKLFALQASAETIALIGMDPVFELSGSGVRVQVNYGTKLALGGGSPVVDWRMSFPAIVDDPLTLDVNESKPIGFVVGTAPGAEPIVIDMDGNTRFGGGAENIHLNIAGFVYVDGAIYFEMGPVVTATLADGLLPITAIAEELGLDSLNAFVGVTETEVSILTIGGFELNAFVGVGGPYWVDTNEDGVMDASELNDDAIGLNIANLTFGLAVMTPTLTGDPRRYIALNAHATQVALVGLDKGFGGGVTLTADGVSIELNITTPLLFGLPVLPVIDLLATFPGSGVVGEDDYVPPGLRVKTGALDTFGNDITVDLAYETPLIRARIEFMAMNLFGVLSVYGSLFFELGPMAHVTLADGTTEIDVRTMTIAVQNVSGFLGWGGPYVADLNGGGIHADDFDLDGTPLGVNASAKGIAITNLDIAIFVGLELDTGAGGGSAGLGVFVAGMLDLEEFAVVGLPGFTMQGTLGLEFNLGLSTSGGVNPIDFVASFPVDATLTPPKTVPGYEIRVGALANPILLNFDDFLFKIELAGSMEMEDVFALVGFAYLEIDGSSFKMLAAGQLVIGPDLSDSYDSATGAITGTPMLSISALGALVIDGDGLALDVDVDIDVNVPGLDLYMSARVLINTTSDDKQIELPTRIYEFLEEQADGTGVTADLADDLIERLDICTVSGLDRCYTISGTAPNLLSPSTLANLIDGSGPIEYVTGGPGAYVVVVMAGGFDFLGFARGEGVGGIGISSGAGGTTFQLVFDARFAIGAAGIELKFQADGVIEVSPAGVLVDVHVEMDADITSLFHLDMSGDLEIDTRTGIAGNPYFRLRLAGRLDVAGIVSVDGDIEIIVGGPARDFAFSYPGGTDTVHYLGGAGAWRFAINNLSGDFGPISIHLDGFIQSDGQFGVNASGSIRLGVDGFNISGTIGAGASLIWIDDNNDGQIGHTEYQLRLYISGSASLEVFGIDIASASITTMVAGRLGQSVTVTVRACVSLLFWDACGSIDVFSIKLPSTILPTQPPTLAQVNQFDSSELELNVGADAVRRRVDLRGITAESYRLTELQNGDVKVELLNAAGQTQAWEVFSGISSISGDFGGDNDRFVMLSGTDIPVDIGGGEGNDLLTYLGSAGSTLSGGGGNDTITGGSGADTLSGGDGNDYLDGRGGVDTVTGGGGDDILFGLITNLFGTGTSELLDGGTGTDIVEILGTTGSDAFALSTTVVSGVTRLLVSYTGSPSGSAQVQNTETVILNPQTGADSITLTGALETAGVQTLRVIMGDGGTPTGGTPTPDGIDSITMVLSSAADVVTITGQQAPALVTNVRGDGLVNPPVFSGTPPNVSQTTASWSGHYDLVLNNSGPTSVDLLTVQSGSGADELVVRGNETHIRLEGGEGDDDVALGSNATTTTNTGGNLEGIRGTVTIVGGAPTCCSDDLVLDDTGDGDGETGTITSTQITGWGLGAGGVVYSEVENITVNLGGGNDTINIRSTWSGGSTTVNANGGADVFNLSSNADLALGNLNSIAGVDATALTINGGDGSDIANISDRADGGVTDTGTLAFSTLTGYAATSTDVITFTGLETMNLDLGAGANNLTIDGPNVTTLIVNSGATTDTVTIDDVLAGTTVTVNGQSANGIDLDDVIVVNGNHGTLIINGNGGNDDITINDNDGTFTVNGGDGADLVKVGDIVGSGIVAGTGTINGGAGNDDVVVRELAGTLTYNGDADSDWLGVLTTSAGSFLTANGGLGDDVFEIGSNAAGLGTTSAVRRALDENGSVDDVDGTVTINGDAPSASDWLYIDDTADDVTGESGLLTSTTVTGLGMLVGVTYGTIEHLEISLGDAATVFNVVSTNGGTDTLLQTGGGNDAINIASGLDLLSTDANDTNAGTVDAIAGHITVQGEGGTDTLNVSDGGDTNDNTGRLTSTDLYGLDMGASSITYATLEHLNIDLGSGDDTFQIDSTHATHTTLDTFAGADTVNIRTIAGHTEVDSGVADDTVNVGSLAPGTGGNVNGIQALLDVDGGTGTDTINVDDTSDSVQNVGSITASSIEGLGMGIDAGHTASDAFHVITIDNAFDGFFTITLGGQTTTALDFDASIEAIRSAIVALGLGIFGTDLDITRTLNGQQLVFTVELSSALGRPLGAISVNGTNLIGITANGIVSSSSSSMTSGRIAYVGTETIVVDLGSGDDVVHVWSTNLDTSTTLNAGAGRDVLLIETIDGATVINGQTGNDSLVLNPIPGDLVNGVNANALTFDGGVGSDHYIVNVFSTGDSELVVHDSAVGDITGYDRLTVNGTAGNDQFLFRAGLNDDDERIGLIALLGNTDADAAFETAERIIYDTSIDAGVTVNGRGGDDHFALDDTASVLTINGGDGADTFQVGQIFGDDNVLDLDFAPVLLAVTRGMLSNGVSYSTTINGGEGPDLFMIFHNVAVLQLNGDNGDDTFVVRTFLHRDEETRIRSGEGRDLIQYVSNSPVAIDGGGGFDTVVVIGTEADDDFVITSGGIYGAGRYVSFIGVEQVDVDGQEGNDEFYVLSTAPGVAVRLFGGQGSDTINVGADAPAVFADDLLGHSGLISNGVESTNGDWDGVHVDGIATEIADNDEAVIVLVPTGGTSIVCEGVALCSLDTYKVVLTSTPTHDVYVTVSAPSRSPDDESNRSYSVQLSTNGTDWADAATLVFSGAGEQTVYVRAYGDFGSEGERNAALMHLVVSDDAAFDALPVRNESIRVVDDERVGVVVLESGVDTLVSESGITDSYSVFLTRAPLTTTTVTLTATAQTCFVTAGECVSTLDLVFDPSTWTAADVRTVDVAATGDDVVEGFHFGYVDHTVASGDVFGGSITAVAGNRITVTTSGEFDAGELRGFLLRDTGGQAGGQSWWIWSNTTSTDNGDGTWTTVITVQGEVDEPPAAGDLAFVNGYTPPVESGVLEGTVDSIDGTSTVVTVAGLTLPTANGGLSGALLRIFRSDGTTDFRRIASNTSTTITLESSFTSLDPGTAFSIVDLVGLVPNTVFVQVADDDTPGVLIRETDGSTRVIEGGATDSYTVVLTADPGVGNTVTITIDALITETYDALQGELGYRQLQQVLLGTSSGDITHAQITLTFTHEDWDDAQTVYVAAIDDDVIDGGDLQAFADSAQRVHLVQGPLYVDGGTNPTASYAIPLPVLLPGEESTSFHVPQATSIDAIEDRQVDTLNVFNQDSVSADVGMLTLDRLTGLGLGPDQFAGGRFLQGGIGYDDLEAVNIHLGSGSDTLTIVNTHEGTTVVHGNDGDDWFNVRTIDGHTNITGDAGNDTFRIGTLAQLTAGGVLDDLNALLVIDGGAGIDNATIDDSGDPVGNDNLGTLTQTTITGLEMVGERDDRVYSLTVGSTTTSVTFTISYGSVTKVLTMAVGFTAAELEVALQALLFPVPEDAFPRPSTGCGTAGKTDCADSVFVWQHDGDYIIGFQGELHDIDVTLSVVPATSPAGATATDVARPEGINYYGFGTTEDLTINLGAGHDRFNVRGTLPHTVLNTLGGDDLIYVSDSADLGLLPAFVADRDLQALHDLVLHGTVDVDDLTFVGSLDRVVGQLDVRAGDGSNTLSISDRDDSTADTDVLITATQISGLAPGLITYDATGDLAGQGFWTTSEGDLGLYGRGINIYAGTDADDITITSVRGGAIGTSLFGATVTTIFAGGGDDTVTVDVDDTAATRRLVVHGNDGDEANDPADLDDDDTIDASASSMPITIFGDAGLDIIKGGTAADQLFGDDGRVLYLRPAGSGGFDVVLGGTPVGIASPTNVDTTFLTPDVLLTRTTTIGTGDAIDAGDGNDIVFGGRGVDIIHGDAGNDLVFGDFGRVETAIAGGWVDASQLPLSMVVATHPFRFFSIDSTNTDDADGDVIDGDAGDDILMGQQGADRIFGGAGDDDLFGGHNVIGGLDTGDALDGGLDDDVILGDNGTILRTGSTVTPLVQALAIGSYTLYGGTTGTSALNPTGVLARSISLFDHATATNAALWGADVIAGGAHDDLVFGGLGNDEIHGDGQVVCATTCELATPTDTTTDGDDHVEGGGGSDLLYGGLGQDDLIGGSSDQFGLTTADMRPDAGDTIYGGNGDLAGRNDPTLDSNRDADVILGDNGRIIRVSGTSGTATTSFLTFSHTAGLTVIPRVTELLDYSPIGDDGYWLVAPGDTPSELNWVPTTVVNIGGADAIHGESGDDIIHGQTGNDALFGDAANDHLYGESGEDWISGGTGDDGIIGDDGRIYTTRNGTAEPLYGLDAVDTDEWIRTPGDLQLAQIYLSGELHHSVQLDLPIDGQGFTTFYVGANDIVYGGLGNDFIHGGQGEDALSGAEALELYYTDDPWLTLSALDYAVGTVEGVLQWGIRAGEFWRYDEFSPRETIYLDDGVTPFLMASDGILGDGTIVDDGKDSIFGDGGNDWIVGGTNHDRLFGGWGDDLLDADDVKETNDGANDQPDVATTVTYADIAYGGAGRDILIGNTGADRLIDWVGEFNSYLVPFSPFGAFAISRSNAPALRDYLLDLGAAQGADITRCLTPPCDRNGEPFGELGMVIQSDPEWRDQTGAPADPQPGNAHGRRDVLRTETFTSTISALQAFATVSGSWEVVNGRYESRAVIGKDAVSIFYVDAALPAFFEVVATMSVDKPKGGNKANAYVIFDYQSPTDFKFAGFDVGLSKVQIGHRTAAGWVMLAQANKLLTANRDYSLLVQVDGQTVTLLLDGVVVLTYTFPATLTTPTDPTSPLVDPLNDGLVGIGSSSSTMRVNDITVQVAAPEISFTQSEEFDAAPAGYTIGAGTWSSIEGAYVGDPGADPVALASTSLTVGANATLHAETLVSTATSAGLAFDYYSVDRFKFVTLDVAAGRVVIGHRTADGFFEDAAFAVAPAEGPRSLRLSVEGSTVTVLLDGSAVGTFTYASLLNDGGLALLASGGPARFESVTLSTDDPDLVPAVPFVSVSDASVVEGGAGGTTTVQVTVSLSRASTDTITVAWSTPSGTAVAGADYVDASGVLTFAPGETAKVITLRIVGDAVQESDEQFAVLLTSPVAALLGDASGQVRILNDDVPSMVTVVATDPSASETGDTAAFVVARDGDTSMPLSVLLAWTDTATWSVDFTVTVTGATLSTDGRTLTFAAGQAAATITVRPRTDSAAEPTETVTLSALPNAAYGLGSPSSASISIADAAILPTLSVSDASVVEGRTDSWVNVTVTLSAPSTSTVTVQLRTYDGTATNGLDYRGQVVTLTFAPGETSKVIAIRTLGDKLREANETFTVQLSAPTNAVLGDDVGVVTILDDDGGK